MLAIPFPNVTNNEIAVEPGSQQRKAKPIVLVNQSPRDTLTDLRARGSTAQSIPVRWGTIS